MLATLAKCHAKEVEDRVARLRTMEDSPVWAVGEHRGVTSKVDVLFSVADLMTEQDIDDLLTVAEYALSESDPALELPETERWAAAIHGRVRDHSAALRDGLCETLVLLSVHGNELFQERLGVNIEARVSDLIARLLTPLDEKLESQERDLPAYAEAAPERLLALLEADMKRDAPALLRLLNPASSGPFAHCPRSGLLWALECVAWNPAYIGRVALLLAELSRVRIDDNILNKPFGSLASLIRSWKPQTAASLDQRVQVLDLVAKRYPSIGWQLCLNEIHPGPRFAGDNYRPRWRSVATDAGGVATRAEVHTLVKSAASILLSRQDHDQTTLGDLVEHVGGLPIDRRDSVWDKIDAWAATQGDEAKAELQGRIRRFAFTRRRDMEFRSTVERARATHDRLQPRDPVVRHLWLFAQDWPRDVWEAKSDGFNHSNFEVQRARIDGWRSAAMDDIWDVHGLSGVLMLVEKGGYTVGRYAARRATDAATVLRECLGHGSHFFDAFMREFIAGCADPAESDVLRELSTCLPEELAVRLWRCAPFREQTWRVLDGLPKRTRTQYWKTVSALGWRLSKSECTEVVERLNEAGRPVAAFRAVDPFWENVETGCLKRLLRAVLASDGGDPTRIEPDQISSALGSLASRGVVTEDEMAYFEFAFIGALGQSEHGIPDLERQLSKHPSLFVRFLAHIYKREDDGEDPPEWHIEGEAQREALAHAAYDALRLVARIPGTDEDGVVQLESLWHWLVEARDLCAKCGRSTVGDWRLGELLAKAPAGKDGAWPLPAVCGALERLRSEDVADGFCSATLNARGVVVGPGGDQTRELAAKFHRHAQQRRADYPFASSIIERIAKHYERSARHEDEQAILAKRLNTWG